ncbi:phosphotransferase enzyme family protein [Clostridium sp.]
MKSDFSFEDVLKQFNFKSVVIDVKPFGLGHINDTFIVNCVEQNGLPIRYILQRINTKIFKTPENLMENIKNVTLYLNEKIVARGGDPDKETLNLVSTGEGKVFYKDLSGDYWRSYKFIEGARTYQVVENLNHFYNAGKAIGNFEKLLTNYPADELFETIPDFHNTKKRYEDFLEAVKLDVMNRAKDVQGEIDFVLARKSEVSVLENLKEEGKLPLRVTHNDTKFNNIMIDDITGEGICIIDLDTIMPGLSLYDFGDSIRSGTNPAEEDEVDLSKVWMDLELFEHFTKGFLKGTDNLLTALELKYLPFSAKLMTFECGIRFLTDYLNGDVYFKIHRENHNLDRTRTQFKMVEDIEEKFDEMKCIVKKYSK